MRGLWQFTWWSLRGQRSWLATLCVGLLSIAVCTTLLAGVTDLSRLNADRAVSRSWHATYDLLVRPPAALSPAERQLSLVDPSGPEQTYGGITQAQVRAIAQTPHVAIAAPEAVVGWVPLRPYQTVTLDHPGMYRITTRLTERTETEETRQVVVALPLGVYAQLTSMAVSADVRYIALDASGTATVAATWPIAALLVGIDPRAEARLTGLQWHPTAGGQPGAAGLPLLLDTHPWSQFTATLTVEEAPLPLPLPAAAGDQSLGTATAAWTTTLRQQLDAAGLISLLTRELGASHPPAGNAAPAQGGGVARYTRTAYTVLSAGNGAGREPQLTSESMGADADGSLTRLHLLPQAATPWVALSPNGGAGSFATFDAAALPALRAEASRATPLGLYRPEPGGVDSVLMPQRSLASWPPMLLTTVQAACALTGTTCVSAVRVRVAGLGPFSPRSAALLQQVAGSIEARTGLHVDVLDGASGRPLVTTVQAAAGGTSNVSLVWIQPHAAVTISSGVNAANILLLAAAVMVGMLALAAAACLAASRRQKDLTLLWQTGWSRGDLRVGTALEAGATALAAALPAWGVSTMLGWLGAPTAPPLAVLGALGAAALLYAGAAMLAAEVARTGRGSSSGRTRWRWARGPWWWALLRRELTWRRGAASLVVAAAAGACALVCLLLLVRWALDGVLYATLLGRQVQVGLSGLHVVVALLTAASATITAGLTLLLAVRERRQEFGVLLAVGWTARDLALQILREGVALGALGGMIGSVVAELLFVALYGAFPLLALAGAMLGAACLGAALCGLGAGYPAFVATRLAPAQVLIEE